MRKAVSTCVAALASGAAVALASAGCFHTSCDETATCPALADGGTDGGDAGHDGGTDGGDSGPPPSCIPSENAAAVADTCGVFVSSSMGSDATGKGTKAAPYPDAREGARRGEGEAGVCVRGGVRRGP